MFVVFLYSKWSPFMVGCGIKTHDLAFYCCKLMGKHVSCDVIIGWLGHQVKLAPTLDTVPACVMTGRTHTISLKRGGEASVCCSLSVLLFSFSIFNKAPDGSVVCRAIRLVGPQGISRLMASLGLKITPVCNNANFIADLCKSWTMTKRESAGCSLTPKGLLSMMKTCWLGSLHHIHTMKWQILSITLSVNYPVTFISSKSPPKHIHLVNSGWKRVMFYSR